MFTAKSTIARRTRRGHPSTIAATDGELLMRYHRTADADAVAELLDRHAGMVWGVCQQVLRRHQDTEDAFQATFLILLRKGHAIRASDSAAGWLYRVALRTALDAKRQSRKRREETLVEEPPAPEVAFPDIQARQATSVMMEELRGLPERYQTPLVMRYLEGQSRRAIAEQTDTTIASVQDRLARGKRLLRLRLARRGVSLAIAFGALASANRAEASHTPAILSSTGALATPTAIAQQLALQGARSMLLTAYLKPLAAVAALSIAATMVVAEEKPSDLASTPASNNSGLVLQTEPLAGEPAAATAVVVQPSPEEEKQPAAHASKEDRSANLYREQLELEKNYWQLKAEALEEKAKAMTNHTKSLALQRVISDGERAEQMAEAKLLTAESMLAKSKAIELERRIVSEQFLLELRKQGVGLPQSPPQSPPISNYYEPAPIPAQRPVAHPTPAPNGWGKYQQPTQQNNRYSPPEQQLPNRPPLAAPPLRGEPLRDPTSARKTTFSEPSVSSGAYLPAPPLVSDTRDVLSVTRGGEDQLHTLRRQVEEQGKLIEDTIRQVQIGNGRPLQQASAPPLVPRSVNAVADPEPRAKEADLLRLIAPGDQIVVVVKTKVSEERESYSGQRQQVVREVVGEALCSVDDSGRLTVPGSKIKVSVKGLTCDFASALLKRYNPGIVMVKYPLEAGAYYQASSLPPANAPSASANEQQPKHHLVIHWKRRDGREAISTHPTQGDGSYFENVAPPDELLTETQRKKGFKLTGYLGEKKQMLNSLRTMYGIAEGPYPTDLEVVDSLEESKLYGKASPAAATSQQGEPLKPGERLEEQGKLIEELRNRPALPGPLTPDADAPTRPGNWRTFHEPSALNPSGWAVIAELRPGDYAPAIANILEPRPC